MTTKSLANMSISQLRAETPSVFAINPINAVSKRYKFLSTADAVRALMERGFVISDSQEQGVRIERNKGYQMHMVRMRYSETYLQGKRLELGDNVFELVLRNSHNLRSSFTVEAAIYRCICENQLVVPSSALPMKYRIRHSNKSSDVQKILDFAVDNSVVVFNQIRQMQQTQVPPSIKSIFAEKAVILGAKSRVRLRGEQTLLEVRRPQDERSDMWTVLNVVQENLVKGDVTGLFKGINGIVTLEKMNKQLWRSALDVVLTMTTMNQNIGSSYERAFKLNNGRNSI